MTAADAATPEPSGEPVAGAWQAWRRGDWRSAAEALTNAALLAGADAECRVLLRRMTKDERLLAALEADTPPNPDPFPALPAARQVSLLQALARLRAELAGPEGVEALLRRSLALARAHLGPDSTQAAEARHRLGAWLRDRGLDSEAETLLREALQGRERLLGPSHPDTLATLHHLAALLEARPDLEAAETCYRDALGRAEAGLGNSHPGLLPYLANSTGWLLTEVGRVPWIVFGLMRLEQGISTGHRLGLRQPGGQPLRGGRLRAGLRLVPPGAGRGRDGFRSRQRRGRRLPAQPGHGPGGGGIHAGGGGLLPTGPGYPPAPARPRPFRCRLHPAQPGGGAGSHRPAGGRGAPLPPGP